MSYHRDHRDHRDRSREHVHRDRRDRSRERDLDRRYHDSRDRNYERSHQYRDHRDHHDRRHGGYNNDRSHGYNDRNDGGYSNSRGGYGYGGSDYAGRRDGRGGRDRGRGGGFRGRGRGGGFRGGGGRGRGRGGGGRGGFGAREKYEPTSLNESLLQEIKSLSLSQRGATPLKIWIDERTNSEFQESKFRKYEIIQTRHNGQETNAVVRERDIPKNAKVVQKTDVWLDDIPRCEQRPQLPGMERVQCITNSMMVQDNSLNVHQYTLTVMKRRAQDDADDGKDDKDDDDESNESQSKPQLPSQEVVLDADTKRDVFFRIKRKIRALQPVHFDNLHVFSFAEDPPTSLCIEAPSPYHGYQALLQQQKSKSSKSQQDSSASFNAIYKECSASFQAQGLNILNRERFRNSNYVKLSRTEDKYYNLEALSENRVFTQRGVDLKCPDLLCISGFKSSIGFTASHTILKTQKCHKLICKHSLYDLIAAFGVSEVDRFIRGKRAVTNYSNQIVELHGLDSSKNLDSTFEQHDGHISFREYYENKKCHGSRSKKVKLLESQEQALVVSHRYEGKGQDKRIECTLYFLPQLLHVIVPMELQSDDTKQRLRSMAHPEMADIVSATKKINATLNAMQRTCLFKTESECLRVEGYVLRPPNIRYKTRKGMDSVCALEFGGREWKNVNAFSFDLRDVYGGSGGGSSSSSNRASQCIQWAILYDDTQSQSRCVDNILRTLSDFKRNRCFAQDPFGEPTVLRRDYRDLGNLRDELRGSRFSTVLCILPENNEASKFKLDITRHTLFSEEPTTAVSAAATTTSNVSGRDSAAKCNHAFDLQFVCERTLSKRNALFNVFETLLLKSQVILYHLDMQLPARAYAYQQCWMIGVKILRKKGGAHLVNICCNRAPFVGTIKFITNHSTFIAGNMDVIPLELMYQTCKKLLKQAVKKVRYSEGEESLPSNIIILRANGGDGLLKAIVSREMAGFKRALHAVQSEKENAWNPGVQFTVLQENCPDSVGIVTHGSQFAYSSKAMIVNDSITSSACFDFFMVLPQKQERAIYGRTLRFIVLSDEYNDESDGKQSRILKLSEDAGLLADFMTMIYSSIWSYSLHIPFPKTPNFPAPIKFAEHYAEWQWGILTTQDTGMRDLEINIDSAKPKIIAPRTCTSSTASSTASKSRSITTIEKDNDDVDMQ
eukprot:CAMPEP_0202694980 /NCGR_PEP_ID=MMETSP1385-20130828/8697_1 /ASSEMBLY_ACC=CAM_ASM_000861 /TAXON_ID=933848 /ORGANISM="Elphidium margaritaceum" /LENGTH=1178 /DNA_ID=CAMNT_0049350929 /DNA_START=86 /DNA_END=3622 /DNA_ORIENTATION=+